MWQCTASTPSIGVQNTVIVSKLLELFCHDWYNFCKVSLFAYMVKLTNFERHSPHPSLKTNRSIVKRIIPIPDPPEKKGKNTSLSRSMSRANICPPNGQSTLLCTFDHEPWKSASNERERERESESSGEHAVSLVITRRSVAPVLSCGALEPGLNFTAGRDATEHRGKASLRARRRHAKPPQMAGTAVYLEIITFERFSFSAVQSARKMGLEGGSERKIRGLWMAMSNVSRNRCKEIWRDYFDWKYLKNGIMYLGIIEQWGLSEKLS